MTTHSFSEGPPPAYSLVERDRRWALARRYLDQEGLDALLVFGEHEDAGPAPFCFDAWFTNDRPGSTILFRKDDAPIVFMPLPTFILDHMESIRRADESWVDTKNVRLGRDSDTIGVELKALGLEQGKVGVIGLEPYIPWYPEGIVPYGSWSKILKHMPKATFEPIGLAFAKLMMPLSEEELAVVRYSASIGDEMAQAMVEAARPGISEAAVYAAGMAAAQRRGSVTAGMHLWSGYAPASGPPQWAYRSQVPRPLQQDDYIGAEVFSTVGMRHTQHQVAIVLGDLPRETERAAQVARACYEAGLKTLRAHTTFGQVAEAMLQPLEAAGGWVRGPQIHGLNPYGSLCRIPGGRSQVHGADDYPSVRDMPTVMAEMELLPGMTFALEPSCGFGGSLVTLGGTVIIGEHEVVELNSYTAHLLHRPG